MLLDCECDGQSGCAGLGAPLMGGPRCARYAFPLPRPGPVEGPLSVRRPRPWCTFSTCSPTPSLTREGPCGRPGVVPARNNQKPVVPGLTEDTSSAAPPRTARAGAWRGWARSRRSSGTSASRSASPSPPPTGAARLARRGRLSLAPRGECRATPLFGPPPRDVRLLLRGNSGAAAEVGGRRPRGEGGSAHLDLGLELPQWESHSGGATAGASSFRLLPVDSGDPMCAASASHFC